MGSAIKMVKVPPNSASFEEAQKRTLEFFRTACRSIPSIMRIYNLYDVVSPSQLRSTVASQIRKNSRVTNSKVIDLLLLRGTQELNNITEHSKQRHHIIGQYVVGREGIVQDSGSKDPAMSDFLKNFYETNYF